MGRISWFVFIFLSVAVSSCAEESMEKATFAGGCFWGMEKFIGEIEGVTGTRVGYTGGSVKNPSYERVCSGLTGHAEAVEVTFDPKKVSYEELVEFFFTHHDSTTLNRQGNDVGTQYRSAVFYHSPEQRAVAEKAVRALDEAKVFRSRVVTEVAPAKEFYEAEDYHQKYLEKNPFGYCHVLRQPEKVEEALKAALKK
jgi:peptide-methionine (S)-S-oxide reductase